MPLGGESVAEGGGGFAENFEIWHEDYDALRRLPTTRAGRCSIR
jgi:hypothetical protein